jgi:hypothetical protein
MLQCQFQAVDAGEVCPKLAFHGVNTSIPDGVVRGTSNVQLHTFLQFLPESHQGFSIPREEHSTRLSYGHMLPFLIHNGKGDSVAGLIEWDAFSIICH